MSKARPIDLNYGHLGEPFYDSHNHGWQFARVPQISQQLRPVARSIIARQPFLAFVDAPNQGAAERLKNIRELTHEYPELLPSSHLLPGLAQASEAVNAVTSAHDSTVSELLAFGRANDVNPRQHGKTVPIIAIAGGEVGQAVRLILLAQEQLGWTEDKNVYLDNLSSEGGGEARWSGNGSPIQQLVFAESEGQQSSWLAVRYHGAISILRPQLRRNDDIWKSNRAGALQSHLDPNKIVALPAQRTRRTQFTDVAFNPWYHQQIATIDQEGHWSVWNLKCLATQRDLWTIKEAYGGNIIDVHERFEEESSHPGDGWGAVLWAGDTNRLIVTGRRALSVFDVNGSPSRLDVPDVVPRNSREWILDIKRSCSVISDIFVVTSRSLHLLRIPASEEANGSDVQCLLSWRHFRDLGDISLRLNLLTDSENLNINHDAAATTVLLYSRLSGVTTLFTIHHPTLPSDRAVCTSDPCLLSIPNEPEDLEDLLSDHRSDRSKARVSALALRVVPFGFYNAGPPSGLRQLYIGNNNTFYQLSILTNDLSLSECLYSGPGTGMDHETHPPDTRIRNQIVNTRTKVSRSFVVPDGFEGQGSEDFFEENSPQLPTKDVSSVVLENAGEDPWTVSSEWLEEEVYEAGSLDGRAFDEILERLYDAIEGRCVGESIEMETLLGLMNTNVFVADPDMASLDFSDFLQNAGRLSIDEDTMELDEGKRMAITKISTPPMQKALTNGDDIQISEVYSSLIKTCITPLSRNIPSRVRIALEKTSRNTAARICLSSHAVSFGAEIANEKEPGEALASGVGSQFSLPDGRPVSAANTAKGKEPAVGSSSPLASSQISEDVGFLPASSLGALPTPEPTPSLHSRSSMSSLTASEDPASLRLRAYAPLAPQPALPTKLSSYLDHWGRVADPDNYDWEAAQQAFGTDDDDETGERVKQWERDQKRRKRPRKPTIGLSSQPQPQRFGGSQPQQLQGESQGSCQATPAIATASQVEPGRFGGRLGKARKKKVLGSRPAGFK